MQRDTQDHWSHKRKVKTWVLNYIYIYISLILSVNTSTKRGTSPGLVAHGRSFHRQGTTNVNGLELIMMLVISLKTNKQKTLNIKNTTLKQILICFHKATIKSLTNESPALYSVDLRLFLPIVLGFCTTSSLTGSGWIPLKIKDKKQLQSVVTTGGVFIIHRYALFLKSQWHVYHKPTCVLGLCHLCKPLVQARGGGLQTQLWIMCGLVQDGNCVVAESFTSCTTAGESFQVGTFCFQWCLDTITNYTGYT